MRILVADDHVMVRDGLRPFLMQLGDGIELFEAGSFAEAVRTLEMVENIGLLLIDLRMPGLSAAHGLTTFRERHPLVRVVVLSSTIERKQIMEAMTLGAAGFIPKRLSAQAMLLALQLIIAGERYVPSALLEEPASPPAGLSPYAAPAERALTMREREILDLLREGLPNKEIAYRLNVSEVTVKSHLCNVFRKLGVQNRVQAARFAIAAE